MSSSRSLTSSSGSVGTGQGSRRGIANSYGSASTHTEDRSVHAPPSFVTEAQQTLLYFRAVDADDPDSILGDVNAKLAINKIPLDIVETMGQDLRYVKFWCLRAIQFDAWCRDFIAKHPICTIVNLNCGLDTRLQRLDPPHDVRWIDVDHPEVLDFRKRLFPTPSVKDYRTAGVVMAQLDQSWIYSLPRDRPTLVVGESNMFYFKPEIVRQIFRTLADHFIHGQIIFDVLGSLTATLINIGMATAQKKSGMKIMWSANDPGVVLKMHPRLYFIEEMRYTEDMPPWFGEFKTKLLKRLPAYRNLGRVIRLGLGKENRDLPSRGGLSASDAASVTSHGTGYPLRMVESLTSTSTSR